MKGIVQEILFCWKSKYHAIPKLNKKPQFSILQWNNNQQHIHVWVHQMILLQYLIPINWISVNWVL